MMGGGVGSTLASNGDRVRPLQHGPCCLCFNCDPYDCTLSYKVIANKNEMETILGAALRLPLRLATGLI